MRAIDFEYDGTLLSDYDFIICKFDYASGADVVDAGSNITFNTISRDKGKSNLLTGTRYDERIQASFDICKNPDLFTDMEISNDEYRDIFRWLNRREFLKFRIVDEDSDDDLCYYNASFNVDKINIHETLYGMRLTMETDSTFGYGEEESVVINVTNPSLTYNLYNISDEIGDLFPVVKITCNASGDLTIKNETANCMTVIKNCTLGEIITLDNANQLIETSSAGHYLYNDFNFEFFKITNSFLNRNNVISASQNCKIEISYYPVIKGSL